MLISVSAHPGDLWKFLRTKRGLTRIPGLVIDAGDAELSDPRDIVNAFAESFSAHVSPPDLQYSGADSGCESGFVVPCIDERDVLTAMASLANKFTAGDDCLPSFVVRDCRYALCQPVLSIINCAIRYPLFLTSGNSQE